MHVDARRQLWTTAIERCCRRTLADVELTAYLGTVAVIAAMSVAGMRLVVVQLGHRIGQQGALLGARIARLEEQNDTIIGALGDLGQRVAHLEGRSA